MELKPREKFLKALRHESIPCVPGFEIEFQLYEDYAGAWPVVGEEMAKLSPKERELAHGHNAELMVKAAEACHHCGLKDIGAYWEVEPGRAADLYMPTLEDRLAHIRAFKKVAGDEFFLFGTVYLPLNIPFFGDLVGFFDELVNYPEIAHAHREENLQEMLRLGDQLLEAGADGLLNDCDLAYNTATFLSPEMMDDYFFPYFNRWVEHVHSLGVPCVWHSDGNLMGIFDRIETSGVDALHCIDPLAGMDIAALKGRTRGTLTLIGNIDCSLIHLGAPEECYDETLRILREVRAQEDSGHIFSSCNTIFLGMPKENYDAVIAARLAFDRQLLSEHRTGTAM